MKTKITLCNLFALVLMMACPAFAEEESTRELADSDREVVTVAVLQHYFANKSEFTKKVGLVAFVQVVPKAGDKPQDASDSVKKLFGNRPIVQDASKSEHDSFGNVVDPKTGQHSAIITIQPVSMVGDDIVSVRVRAYSGPKSATSYQYQLQKVDNRWRVVSAKATGSA